VLDPRRMAMRVSLIFEPWAPPGLPLIWVMLACCGAP